METNTTAAYIPSEIYVFLNKYIRPINFILSCTSLLCNLFLIIILSLIGRRQCTTYFLLILMAICDLLYCIVFISIVVTLDGYINIINHEILCPLSFFLTPFTFTGSTLLLLICLLHCITNYVRKYDTVLGQLGGRLSVVFVLAFIIIRSVLDSTSIELFIPNEKSPHGRQCTVDMNTSPIVKTVQSINHVFATVTDILVYLGWIIVLVIYLISFFCCKKSYFCNQTEPTAASLVKPYSYTSLLLNDHPTTINNVNHEQNTSAITIELSDMLNITNETPITNQQRHNDVSLIILSTGLISVLLYLPVMVNKYSTLYSVYRQQGLLTEDQTIYLQTVQHTAHLFCLLIRFIPYLIFNKRVHLLFRRLIGMKCMKIERRTTLSRRRKYKTKHKYICDCQCYRRREILDFNNNREDEQ